MSNLFYLCFVSGWTSARYTQNPKSWNLRNQVWSFFLLSRSVHENRQDAQIKAVVGGDRFPSFPNITLHFQFWRSSQRRPQERSRTGVCCLLFISFYKKWHTRIVINDSLFLAAACEVHATHLLSRWQSSSWKSNDWTQKLFYFSVRNVPILLLWVIHTAVKTPFFRVQPWPSMDVVRDTLVKHTWQSHDIRETHSRQPVPFRRRGLGTKRRWLQTWFDWLPT